VEKKLTDLASYFTENPCLIQEKKKAKEGTLAHQ